jgi:hypothetical protein
MGAEILPVEALHKKGVPQSHFTEAPPGAHIGMQKEYAKYYSVPLSKVSDVKNWRVSVKTLAKFTLI